MKCLNDIYHIDKQMIQNHQVTCENHEQLLGMLKKINTIIQNASRLRGKWWRFLNTIIVKTYKNVFILVNNNKTETIATFRQAVASENMTVLKKLIESGNK